MPIETIIIEFQSDVSQLTAGEAKIADSVKKVSTALAQQQTELGREQATISKLTGSLDKLTGESKEAVQQLLKLSGKEVVAGFVQLGLSVDDYLAGLKATNSETEKVTGKTKTAQQELKKMERELINLAAAGKENTKQFRELQSVAGKLKDAIGDVKDRIKVTGSDTRVFDGLLNAAQGVAGGFAVMQGATALFGDESAELQETLLKVNSAMAILQGLQQVQQVLQKESAASLLFLNNAQKTNAVVTNLSAAAESKNIVVKTAAAVATRALSAAIALSNPITLAVVAVIVAVTAAYKFFTAESKAAAEQQKLLNLALENSIDIGAELDDGIKRGNDKTIARLKAQGATEADIRKQNLKTTRELLKDARAREDAFREQADAAETKRRVSTNVDEVKRLEEVGKKFAVIQQNRIDLETELSIKGNENIAAVRKEDEDAQKKLDEEAKKRIAAKSGLEKERIGQQIAGIQLAQLELDKESFAYRNLQVEVIRLTAKLENLDQVGNKALLTTAESQKVIADLTKARIAEVTLSEEGFTDTIKIEGQKRIDATDAINKALATKTKASIDDITQKQKLSDKERIDIAFQTASQITAIFAEAFKQQTENQLREVDDQRKRIKELEELGAISAKESERRMKLLDEKERQIKIKAAQRDKAIAIFQAIINTAAAVTKVLAFPVLAAIAAALGAAQIALIASRPIPKFGQGKKNRYEGIAEVGETGAELIERNGHYEVAKNRQLTWLGKDDKVYNPAETARMLEGAPAMGMPPVVIAANRKQSQIDYDKVGKSIAKHLPQHNISFDKDGFQYAVKEGQKFIKYLDKRRKF